MTIEEMLQILYSKDNNEAYQTLQELENLLENSDKLYPYTERFAEMTKNDNSYIRVRGFRLFCKQAKWSKDNSLSQYLSQVLTILNDEKPSTVRQALSALYDTVKSFPPQQQVVIYEAANHIDVMRYKESMRGLIQKDIRKFNEQVKTIECNLY